MAGGSGVSDIGGSGSRELLTATRTYYVRTDGVDTNTGLVNTAGGAFLTIQKAVDVVSTTLDCNGQSVIIQVGDGTYTASVVMKPILGVTTLTIQGNSATPTNVVVSVTGGHCFSNQIGGTILVVKDMRLSTTTSGMCLNASFSGHIQYSGIDFGACAQYQIYATNSGRCTVLGNYTISGGAQAHYATSSGGHQVIVGRTITASGSPVYSASFVYCTNVSYIETSGCTYSGVISATRYQVSVNSAINTAGGGANYFPGTSPGTAVTNGLYA